MARRDKSALGDLFSGRGEDVNEAKIGGTTELLGNPAHKLEKPATIIRFPGGHVEIARTTDNNYWVHVAVRTEMGADKGGKVIGARIDFDGRYGDEANAVLRREVAAADVNHIAFLVAPGDRGDL